MASLNLDQFAIFTYCWGDDYFVETENENFIWKKGKNTISRYSGTLEEYLMRNLIPKGVCQGTHLIKDYCPGVSVLS